MEFQRKLERVCAIDSFAVADVWMLRALLVRLLEATDLEDALQWFHILRALFTLYILLCLFNGVDHRALEQQYRSAIARAIHKWFFLNKEQGGPLHVVASERERCMDRLTDLMADELKQAAAICDDPHVQRTIDALAC